MKPAFRRRDADAPEPSGGEVGATKGGDEAAELALTDLAQPTTKSLAEIAMFELILFQELSDAVMDAPALANKQALGSAANEALERHKAMLALLDARAGDGTAAMTREARPIEAFAVRVAGRDWFERITSCYVLSGFLHDLYRELLACSGDTDLDRVEALLNDEEEQVTLRAILEPAFANDVTLDDRLAMWGRRVIGEGMVFVRDCLGIPRGTVANEYREGADAVVDALTSTLMANHSRRMNSIGFAA